jgi:hypothetical protein
VAAKGNQGGDSIQAADAGAPFPLGKPIAEGNNPHDLEFEDVRLNPPAARYVLRHNLISLDGQLEFIKKGKKIDFPRDSIEVKSRWIVLDPEDVPQQALKFWYWRQDRYGRYWGLESLHITTKDIHNWFWATFENKANYGASPKFPSTDDWGFINGRLTGRLTNLLEGSGLQVDVWKNYRLTGAQVDFTDSTGRAVCLGNNQMEGILPGATHDNVSCMTCHARSTVALKGDPLDFKVGSDRVGAPNPSWFFNQVNGKQIPTHAQRDFSWSLARAKPRSKVPTGIFWSISVPPDKHIYFENDIMPLFKDDDMQYVHDKLHIDLWNYDSLVISNNGNNLTRILKCYQHKGEVKLPRTGLPWPKYFINEYISWSNYRPDGIPLYKLGQ